MHLRLISRLSDDLGCLETNAVYQQTPTGKYILYMILCLSWTDVPSPSEALEMSIK